MKITSFEEAQNYLETLIPTSYKAEQALKLERVEALLKLLGDPHKKVNFVHVGGTAGKGSTSMILATLLQNQGLKVGLHVSPHLQKITERMQINRINISDQRFVNEVSSIVPLVNQVAASLSDSPTYFEVLVALAFKYFASEKVDFAVVEVGLGGTLDATNVITPKLSIVTNVGLDHTEILGDTVEKIATDKAGIIKKEVPVITAVKQDTVQTIIREKTERQNSPLFLWDRDFNYKIVQTSLNGTEFDYSFGDRAFSNLTLATPGQFQVENASLALTAILNLSERGFFEFQEDKLRNALAKMNLPGRFEIVSSKPLIILDGAHNPLKIQSLLASLKTLFPGSKFIFLLAFKKTKDIKTMLSAIEPLAERVIVTQFATNTDTGKNSAAPVAEVCNLIQKDIYCIGKENLAESYLVAKSLASPDFPLIITGSLYLVGEVRDQFLP